MQSPRQKYGRKPGPKDTLLLEDAFPLRHLEALWVLVGSSGRGSGGAGMGEGPCGLKLPVLIMSL